MKVTNESLVKYVFEELDEESDKHINKLAKKDEIIENRLKGIKSLKKTHKLKTSNDYFKWYTENKSSLKNSLKIFYSQKEAIGTTLEVVS